MMIIPAIELMGGHPVSLNRGRIDEPAIWHVDPVARATEWAHAGAEWVHVTDLDAVAGRARQEELVLELLRKVPAPIQLAGGFRTLDQIAHWIDKGAGRIVVSTIAAQEPWLVKAAAKRFPDQIVLAVDVWKGQVMAQGWREPTAFTPEDFIRAFAADPLAGIIVTDIDADLAEPDASLALVTGLAGVAHVPLFARGLVHDLDDIARLNLVPGVAGAVIGRPLFERAFGIAEALEAARALAEPTAPFI